MFSPGRIGPLALRNRVIKAATYEGLSHASRVTEDLVAFHRAYAAGGVGMTTVAYCAVARTDGPRPTSCSGPTRRDRGCAP